MGWIAVTSHHRSSDRWTPYHRPTITLVSTLSNVWSWCINPSHCTDARHTVCTQINVNTTAKTCQSLERLNPESSSCPFVLPLHRKKKSNSHACIHHEWRQFPNRDKRRRRAILQRSKTALFFFCSECYLWSYINGAQPTCDGERAQAISGAATRP